VKLKAPEAPASVRKKAEQDRRAGEHPHRASRKRSRGTERALKREPRGSASRKAVSRQAKRSSGRRGKTARRNAALKAARTRKAA
jgi:hypothetical protein